MTVLELHKLEDIDKASFLNSDDCVPTGVTCLSTRHLLGDKLFWFYLVNSVYTTYIYCVFSVLLIYEIHINCNNINSMVSFGAPAGVAGLSLTCNMPQFSTVYFTIILVK